MEIAIRKVCLALSCTSVFYSRICSRKAPSAIAMMFLDDCTNNAF